MWLDIFINSSISIKINVMLKFVDYRSLCGWTHCLTMQCMSEIGFDNKRILTLKIHSEVFSRPFNHFMVLIIEFGVL